MTDHTTPQDPIRIRFADWPKPPKGTHAELAAWFLAGSSSSSIVRDHAIVSIALSLETIANAYRPTRPTEPEQ